MNLTAEFSPTQRNRAASSATAVLVVDDEPQIRELLAMMMEMRGCEVLAAGSGVEALGMVCALDDDGIDLVITDLCMPGMSGTALAEELRRLRPGIKTIFTSGYSPEEMAGTCGHIPGSVCVSKPFQPHALDNAIRALFEQPPRFDRR